MSALPFALEERSRANAKEISADGMKRSALVR